MFLALKDLVNLFNDKQGIQDDVLFRTISDKAAEEQPMGLFVPVNSEAGELLEAISHGAIAAVWDKEKTLPRYTPTQFPIFFTNDLVEAMREIINLYIEKLDGETNKNMDRTNFKISNNTLLNKNNQTYDIAGQLAKLLTQNNQERRG
ncbi:hypothetical protein [Neobacillus cucumis]|uniref:Uncharacterized protein n=1 Tax=Neobacillus cucumis TaxID=1740721 RepID=A0A2N5HLQ8_9BACI|nr:hypothetical protein [Neobacillus cucumis]PLS06459.1 hypothetical protein CVD27_07910 [Neobacillus cucumis]